MIDADASQFFSTLYPDGLPTIGEVPSWLLLWTEPGNQSYWRKELNEECFDTIERLTASVNVYVGCGLSPQNYGPTQRCRRDDIAGIPGLWLDLDFQKGHKKRGLMEGPAHAEELLQMLGLEPTMIIHTGHGWHAWWCFKEVWMFESSEERGRAARLMQFWNATAIAKAKSRGWTLDNVSDLARVMRPAGTYNQKGDNPILSVIVRMTGKRYDPTDFEEFMTASVERDAAALVESLPQGNYSYVLNANATPDVELFSALAANHPDFKATWDHQRNFPSESEYDLSLASMASRCEWPTQEIVNLLIAHRRKYGADLKLDRSGANCYYRLTLNRAQEQRGESERDEVLEQFNQKQSVSPDIEDNHAALKDLIGRKLGVHMSKFLKYLMTPPQYRIEINDVMVDLGGIEGVLSFPKFERAIADELRIRLKPVTAKEWRVLTEYLLKVAVEEDVGPEGSARDSLAVMLDQWIRTNLRTESQDRWEKLLGLHEPFVKDAQVYFTLIGLSHYLYGETSEKLGLKSLAFQLKGMGYEGTRVAVDVSDATLRRAFRRVWRYGPVSSLHDAPQGVGSNGTSQEDEP